MSSKQSNLKHESQPERLGLKELIAMGVGGMVGGGIFSVLGLSVGMAGHAAPIAFGLGGVIALLTGMSYARLGLAFRDDGGSFTYVEHAFKHRNIAGIAGWVLLLGYIGTLGLYSYTFGAYGSAMLGAKHGGLMHHVLQSAVLLIFLGINLYGVRAAGTTEDLIVLVKVLILGLFAVVGLVHIKLDQVLPLFDKPLAGIIMGAGLIFVAYEGFELIPNAVNEMERPERNLGRSIIISILIAASIYIVVSLVAVGNLTPEDIQKYKEYALAVAAKPFLGQVGFLLIGLGALLSTASAINATMFGTARLGMVMAQQEALPKVFSYRERIKPIPWVSLLAITIVTLIFVNAANLTIISAFASSTFLLIFALINLSALKLCRQIKIFPLAPLVGLLLTLASLAVLYIHMAQADLRSLEWLIAGYVVVVIAELAFSERRIFRRRKPASSRPK